MTASPDPLYAIRNPRPDENPSTWLQAQLDFLDTELAKTVRVRDKHRTDAREYEALGALLPVNYHRTQAAICTQRITDLLDLRLFAQGKAHEQEQQP